MIAYVLEVPVRVFADDVALSSETPEDISLWRRDAVKPHQLAANLVQRAQLVLARVVGKHGVFDGVEPVSHVVDEWQRVVDEPVDNRVKEPVRTPAACSGRGRLRPSRLSR